VPKGISASRTGVDQQVTPTGRVEIAKQETVKQEVVVPLQAASQSLGQAVDHVLKKTEKAVVIPNSSVCNTYRPCSRCGVGMWVFQLTFFK